MPLYLILVLAGFGLFVVVLATAWIIDWMPAKAPASAPVRAPAHASAETAHRHAA